MIISNNKPIANNILLSIVVLVAVIISQAVFHRYSSSVLSDISDNISYISNQKYRVLNIAGHYHLYVQQQEKQKYQEYVLLTEAASYHDFISNLVQKKKDYFYDSNEVLMPLIKQWQKMYALINQYNTESAHHALEQYVDLATHSVVYLDIINKHMEHRASRIKENSDLISAVLLLSVFLVIIWIIFHSIRTIFRPLSLLTEISQKMAKGDFVVHKDMNHSKEFSNISAALKTVEKNYHAETTHLKTQAHYDKLTGLLNRRGFEDYFRDKIRSDESCQSCSILLLDIDRFKPINDTYGHDVGDQVLHTVGKALKDFVREEDVVARYGGEEFIFAISGSGSCDDLAWEIAERTRKLIADLEISLGSETFIQITVSIGIFTSTEKNTSLDEAIKYADMALYKAKNSGRNKVIRYSDLD